jgi:hypothetical protein
MNTGILYSHNLGGKNTRRMGILGGLGGIISPKGRNNKKLLAIHNAWNYPTKKHDGDRKTINNKKKTGRNRKA